MDRNSIIGFLLLGVLLVGYMLYNQPSEAELKQRKAKIDSVAALQNSVDTNSNAESPQAIPENKLTADTAPAINDSLKAISDSIHQQEINNKYGVFANSSVGENNYVILENELLKAKISTMGGKLVSVELKKYHTYDSLPLLLFDEDSSSFNIEFFDNANRSLSSSSFYFTPDNTELSITGTDSGSVSLKLFAGDKDKYIEFLYSLKGNSYLLSYNIRLVNLNEISAINRTGLGINWSIASLIKEKSAEAERNVTSVYYKFMDDEVDYLSETGEGSERLTARTHWISFKQQFFSAAIICDNGFDKTDAKIESKIIEDGKHTKYLSASVTLPYSDETKGFEPIRFYFGPNHYQTLKAVKIGLEEQINLGWTIFGWVNKFLVIPIFNFLDTFGLNYGIIILILTLIIKLILFPLTYKNYKSSAKMKVLKPDIDELNKKFGDDEPLKKQQAIMALYRKAGVNPLAGCIPMLLQLPILYAMFRFFPASIELRQESFLWAEDLSSYDSIYELGFSIPAYGDHISLFTVLMAISTFLYTIYNMQMTVTSGPQAAQMKIMMYIMPFMLLVFFNNYSSALSYYYFTANIISILQQLVIKKWFIDEAAIHAQIEEQKKKPVQKSKFQQRLEDMAKQRGYKPAKKK